MRTLFLFVLVLIAGEVSGQTKPQTKSGSQKGVPCDTVIRFGNRKIPVTKLTIGSTTVTYALIDKPDSMIRLEKKEIERILYRNGRVEQFNKAVVEVVRPDQWQAVLITRDEGDVQGLYNRGEVKARSSANSRSSKKAEEGAIIKIQKLAAAKKSTIILITHDEFYGGYGEIPGYLVEGIAYGTEPLETGTDVVDPKNKDARKDSKSKSTK
jgi:hypothetical protein